MPGYKRIPKEIREEIISKVKEGRSVVELSSQYGVSSKTIYAWLQLTGGISATGKSSLIEHNRLKRENDELKRIIGLLTLEIQRGKKD
ncbi:MAG: transposase [bacterium]